MLDKKDVKTIQNIVTSSLGEFLEIMLKPYFENNDKEHKEIKTSLDKQDETMDKILRKLERNEDQHDEIFQDQDKYEKAIKGHEKRIKRLETTVAS